MTLADHTKLGDWQQVAPLIKDLELQDEFESVWEAPVDKAPLDVSENVLIEQTLEAADDEYLLVSGFTDGPSNQVVYSVLRTASQEKAPDDKKHRDTVSLPEWEGEAPTNYRDIRESVALAFYSAGVDQTTITEAVGTVDEAVVNNEQHLEWETDTTNPDIQTELTRNQEGVTLSLYDMQPDQPKVLEEAWWTWGEFTGMDTTELPISAGGTTTLRTDSDSQSDNRDEPVFEIKAYDIPKSDLTNLDIRDMIVRIEEFLENDTDADPDTVEATFN